MCFGFKSNLHSSHCIMLVLPWSHDSSGYRYGTQAELLGQGDVLYDIVLELMQNNLAAAAQLNGLISFPSLLQCPFPIHPITLPAGLIPSEILIKQWERFTARDGHRPEFGYFRPLNLGLIPPPQAFYLSFPLGLGWESGAACLHHFWVASGCHYQYAHVNRKWPRHIASTLA